MPRACLNFITLTFRALGRNHIVSTRFNAITMLGFNYTVGFPETVTVLSSSLIVARNPEGYSKPAPEET